MKKWLIIALALVILGLLVCVGAASLMKFDFRSMDTASASYRTETYEVKGSFRNISVDIDIEELSFLPAEDGKAKVVCVEKEDEPHSVSVAGDTLTVESFKGPHFSFSIGISTQQEKVTVYLPEREYAALQIRTDTGDATLPGDFSFESISFSSDTGDIRCLASAEKELILHSQTGHVSLESVSAGSLELETDTGSIRVDSVRCSGDAVIGTDTGRMTVQELSCRSLTSRSDTGKLLLDRVVAEDSFTITGNTGDVEFRDSDAASISVKTDSGDVTGTLLTEKVFTTDTDTGKVDVPASGSGGPCRITTDTGDIRIKVG